MKSILFFSMLSYAMAIHYNGCTETLYNLVNSRCEDSGNPLYTKEITLDGTHLEYDNKIVNNVCQDNARYCDVYLKPVAMNINILHGDKCPAGTYIQKNTPIVYGDYKSNQFKIFFYRHADTTDMKLHDDTYVADLCRACPTGKVAPVDNFNDYPVKIFAGQNADGDVFYEEAAKLLSKKSQDIGDGEIAYIFSNGHIKHYEDNHYYMDIFDIDTDFTLGYSGKSGKFYRDYYGYGSHAFALDSTDFNTHTGESLLDATTEIDALPSKYLVFQDPKKCVDCPAGKGAFDGKYCATCPAGETPKNGVCTKCNIGTEAKTGSFVCTSCEKGKFNGVEGTSCTSCGPGKTTFVEGATSVNDCQSCADGSEIKDNMQCGLCEDGFAGTGGTCSECPSLASIDTRTHCVICPAGKGGINGVCKTCPIGTRSVSSDGINHRCVSCPAGTYQDHTGRTDCIDCAVNKVSNEGSTMASDCEVCDSNFKPEGGECTACEPGQISSVGDTECIYCQVGKFYVYDEHNGGECKTCEPGRVKTETDREDYTSRCRFCVTGHQIGSDRTQCQTCGVGKEFSNNDGRCIDCTLGRYSDNEGDCQGCPAGSFSDDRETCKICPKGTYSDQVDQYVCKGCSRGTYSPFSGATDELFCIPCSSGKYQNDEAQASCKSCQDGYISDPLHKPTQCLKSCPAGERRSGDGCIECETGKYLELGSGYQCKVCPAGSQYNGQSCETCPEGKYFNPDLIRLSGPHGDILTKTTVFDITTLGDEKWLQLPGEHPWEKTTPDCKSGNVGTFPSHVGTNDGSGQEITGNKGDEHTKLSTYMCSQRCQDYDKFFVYIYEHEQYCGCGNCHLSSNDGVTQYKKPEQYSGTGFTSTSFEFIYQNRLQTDDTCQPCPAGSFSTLDRKGCESRKGNKYINSDTGITERSPKIIFQSGDLTDYTVEIDGMPYKDPDIRVCKNFIVYRNLTSYRLKIANEDTWISSERDVTNGNIDEKKFTIAPGEYEYFCTLSPTKMKGKLVIKNCEEKVVPCETGYIRERGLCTPCPKGQTSDGLTCADCPTYKTSLGDGKCISCPAGRGGQGCTRCSQGKFSAQAGTDCTYCTIGEFSTEDRTTCTKERAHATCNRNYVIEEQSSSEYPGTCDDSKCTPTFAQTDMLTCTAEIPDGYIPADVKNYGNMYKYTENAGSAGFKDTPAGAMSPDGAVYVPSSFKHYWTTGVMAEDTSGCHDIHNDIYKYRYSNSFFEKSSDICNEKGSESQCDDYAEKKGLTFGSYTTLSGTSNYDYNGCFEHGSGHDSQIYYGTGYILKTYTSNALHFKSQYLQGNSWYDPSETFNNGEEFGQDWNEFPTHLSLSKSQCDEIRGGDSTLLTNDGYNTGQRKPFECHDNKGTAIYMYPSTVIVPVGTTCEEYTMVKSWCFGSSGNQVDQNTGVGVSNPVSYSGTGEYFHRKEVIKSNGDTVDLDYNTGGFDSNYNTGSFDKSCWVTDNGYFINAEYTGSANTARQICTNIYNKPLPVGAWYAQNKVTPWTNVKSLYNPAKYFLKHKHTSDRKNIKPICFGQTGFSNVYPDASFTRTFPEIQDGEYKCLNGDEYVLDTESRRRKDNAFLIHLIGGDQTEKLLDSNVKISSWISQIKHNCKHFTGIDFNDYDFSKLDSNYFKKGDLKSPALRNCISEENKGIVFDSPTWRVYHKSDNSNTWLDQRVYSLDTLLFRTVNLECTKYECEECSIFGSEANADYSQCILCPMETAFTKGHCQGCPAGKKAPLITNRNIEPENCELCPAGKFSSGASPVMLITDASSAIYNTTDTWSGLHCFDACDGYPLEETGNGIKCKTECPSNQYHDDTQCVDFICIGGERVGESCDCPDNHELQHGVCRPCPYGQKINGLTCENCPDTQIFNNGDCETCPEGQIPDTGKCKACPFGKTSSGTQCVPCEDGQSSYGDGKCVLCPPGVGGSGGMCNLMQGCTNPAACNYNPIAAIDDGSCQLFNKEFPLCQRCVNEEIIAIPDTNNNQVCDDKDIEGCMVASACNYNETANFQETTECNMKTSEDCDRCDNGEVIRGDVVPPDDGNGVCDIDDKEGCRTEGACNVDSAVTIHFDDKCNFPSNDCDTCNDDGTVNEDYEDPNDDDTVCEKQEMPGCMVPGNFNYDASYNVVGDACYPIITGCFNTPTSFNYIQPVGDKQVDVNTDDGSCYPIRFGCMDDTTSFNYIQPVGDVMIDVNTDDGSCYPVIEGCIDPTACNFIALTYNTSVDANTDDGTCLLANASAPHCEICENLGTSQGKPIKDDEDDNGNGICDKNDYRVCLTVGACNYLMTEDGTIHRHGDSELVGALNRDCVFANPRNTKGELSVRCRDNSLIQNSLEGTTKAQRQKYRNDVIQAYDDPEFNFYPMLQERDPRAPGNEHSHYENTSTGIKWAPYDKIFTTSCPDRDPQNGVCDDNEVRGCTEVGDCNYNPNATYNPGGYCKGVPDGCQFCEGGELKDGDKKCNLEGACEYDPTKSGACYIVDKSDSACWYIPAEDNCNYCSGTTIVRPHKSADPDYGCKEYYQIPTCEGDTFYFDAHAHDLASAYISKCRPKEFFLQRIKDEMGSTCELPMAPPETFWKTTNIPYIPTDFDAYFISTIKAYRVMGFDQGNWEGGTWEKSIESTLNGDLFPSVTTTPSYNDYTGGIEWYIYRHGLNKFYGSGTFYWQLPKCPGEGERYSIALLLLGDSMPPGPTDYWQKLGGESQATWNGKNVYFRILLDRSLCSQSSGVPPKKSDLRVIYENNFCSA